VELVGHPDFVRYAEEEEMHMAGKGCAAGTAEEGFEKQTTAVSSMLGKEVVVRATGGRAMCLAHNVGEGRVRLLLLNDDGGRETARCKASVWRAVDDVALIGMGSGDGGNLLASAGTLILPKPEECDLGDAEK
jgi:hypothetical protein